MADKETNLRGRARPEPDRLIPGDDVDRMFGVQKTSRYRYMERGIIPQPIKLPQTIARWSYNECVDALEKYKAAARGVQP